MIRLKRIYEPPGDDDGFRVLVDRLWPRGVSKETASVDLWLKEIAPSTPLRKWFAHDPAKWDGFRTRYKEELKGKLELLAELKALNEQHGIVTLLYAAKDDKYNQAVVLQELLS